LLKNIRLLHNLTLSQTLIERRKKRPEDVEQCINAFKSEISASVCSEQSCTKMNLLTAISFLALCSLGLCRSNFEQPSSISGEDPNGFLGDDILVGIEQEVEDALIEVLEHNDQESKARYLIVYMYFNTWKQLYIIFLAPKRMKWLGH